MRNKLHFAFRKQMKTDAEDKNWVKIIYCNSYVDAFPPTV